MYNTSVKELTNISQGLATFEYHCWYFYKAVNVHNHKNTSVREIQNEFVVV